MKRLAFIWIVLASSGAQPVFAQWTLGAYIGWAAPFKANVRIQSTANDTDLRLQNVQFQTHSFQRPLYYGIRAGRMFGSRFGAELELTHLKIFAEVDTPARVNGSLRGAPVSGEIVPRSIVEQLDASHGLNMILGNFVARFPVHSGTYGPGRTVFTARLGIGPTVSHTEASVLGMTAQHYEYGGVALQAAGGLEVPVGAGLYMLGEYKYTYTRQRLSIGSATAVLSPATQHIVGGVGYRF